MSVKQLRKFNGGLITFVLLGSKDKRIFCMRNLAQWNKIDRAFFILMATQKKIGSFFVASKDVKVRLNRYQESQKKKVLLVEM